MASADRPARAILVSCQPLRPLGFQQYLYSMNLTPRNKLPLSEVLKNDTLDLVCKCFTHPSPHDVLALKLTVLMDQTKAIIKSRRLLYV